MFSKKGQKEIKEDFKKTGMLIASIKEVATKESVSFIGDNGDGQTNFFTNNLNKLVIYEGTAKFMSDPKNARNIETLKNPNASIEEKNQAQQSLHEKLANELGVEPAKLVQILDQQYKGATSSEDGKVYIADNLHKTTSDIVNTIGNETSDVVDLARDKNVEKTKDYLDNRDEYSTLIGNLTQELLNDKYVEETGSSLEDVVNNKIGTNLSKANELNQNVINNTREFDKLDKSKIAHRQLNNTELKFVQDEKNIKKFAKLKYKTDNPTPKQLQGAKHALGQTAVSMADNAWKKILGEDAIDEKAKEFLQENVISLKDKKLTEFAKENFGENTSIAKENIAYYKEVIHPGIDKNLQGILKEDIKKLANNAGDTLGKLKEQGVIKTVKTASGKVKDYVVNTDALEKLEDGKELVGNILSDSIGSLIKLGYNASTSSEDLAKIYKISKEEATTVKAILAVAAASELGGNKKKVAEGAVDLGVDKDYTSKLGLGALKKPNANVEIKKDQDILLNQNDGLQVRKIGDGKFNDTVNDGKTTYLFTVDNTGIKLVKEDTKIGSNEKVKHTNLSSKASFGGEVKFDTDGNVVLNPYSGRYGIGNHTLEETKVKLENTKKAFEKLGYNVKVDFTPKLVSTKSTGKRASDNTVFTQKTQYQSSDKGTGNNYTVFQRDDIDLDEKFLTKEGKLTTNRDIMKKGGTPYAKNDKGERVQLNLHHSQQKGKGPLFEVTSTTHQKGSNQKALHPYGKEKNPIDPVDRKLFDKDRNEYWKERLKEMENKN